MKLNLFGGCLSELRRARKLKQKELALMAGLDPSYLAGLESGRRLPPRPSAIARLCEAMEACSEEHVALLRAASIAKAITALDCQVEHPGASDLVMLLGALPRLNAGDLAALSAIATRMTTNLRCLRGEVAM